MLGTNTIKAIQLQEGYISDFHSTRFDIYSKGRGGSIPSSKGRIVGLSIKQTNKELIVIQEEVRGLKGAKGMLEQLMGVV